MKSKTITIFLALLVPVSAYSADTHYCSGMVTDIITRATWENTQIRIEGMNGWARIGYGGDQNENMHDRQFSMLLSAYIAGKSVTLEFDDQTLSCSDDHDGTLIRYVRLR